LKLLYPKNISFECQRCAKCCGDTPKRKRKVLMLEREVEQISHITNLKPEEFSTPASGSEPYRYTMIKQEGKCVFLKGAVCQIYNHRPLLCRFFPFCLEQVGSEIFEFNYSEECPGIGLGKVIEEEIFTAMLAEALNVMEKIDD
jgi:Fe-S-cluster containining protein